MSIPTAGVYDIEVQRAAGPEPGFVKLFFTGDVTRVNGTPESIFGPTALGHNNAAGSIVVGAADVEETPGFGVSPAIMEDSSSPGGVPILFDTMGNRLDYPIVRQTPALTAPDRTCTTFFGDLDESLAPGCYRFFGSSAAAPSAAGVAALMLELDHSLSPSDIRSILTGSASDMDGMSTPNFDFGFDFDTGFGFLEAFEAIKDVDAMLSNSSSKKSMSKSMMSKSGSRMLNEKRELRKGMGMLKMSSKSPSTMQSSKSSKTSCKASRRGKKKSSS